MPDASRLQKPLIKLLRAAAGVLGSAVLGLSLVAWSATATAADFSDNPRAKAFVERMATEYGFDRAEVQALLDQAVRKQSILDAMSRPAEKTKEWHEYRAIFVTDSRIQGGAEFMKKHRETLARAEREFGVPATIITAIIGVETRYGTQTGGYRVLDALATLGFDYPPRADFFANQLAQYLLLVREQKFDPIAMTGSYAGAMGYGQFIPSSYRAYAIDYDGDKIADIINNPVDAIGSVANYFSKHGWKKGAAVVVPAAAEPGHDATVLNKDLRPVLSVAELQQKGIRPTAAVDLAQPATAMRLMQKDGPEYWLGLHNFYVITRYNHSILYAMSVYQLSLSW